MKALQKKGFPGKDKGDDCNAFYENGSPDCPLSETGTVGADARYISNFQRIEVEVILEANTTLWNKGERRALGQLSAQQLLDIMEAAQHVNLDQPFVDELYKELRRKLTQEQG